MSLFDVWNSIPHGSTLIVELEPETGFGAAGTHTVKTANGPVLTGPIAGEHFDLVIPIGAGEQHKVEFQLSFAGKPINVEVVARVEEPDGSLFGDERRRTAKLSASSPVFTAMLFANGES
jgi:hypothetical protein